MINIATTLIPTLEKKNKEIDETKALKMPHTTTGNDSLQTISQNITKYNPNKNKFRAGPACDRCRLKKIKCDGNKPNCDNCKKAGLECQTTYKLKRRGTGRGYTRSLEIELNNLKKLLRSHNIKYDNEDIFETDTKDVKLEDGENSHQDNLKIKNIEQDVQLLDKESTEDNVSDNVYPNVANNNSESKNNQEYANLNDKTPKNLEYVVSDYSDFTNFGNLLDWNNVLHIGGGQKDAFGKDNVFENHFLQVQRNLVKGHLNSLAWKLNLNPMKKFCPNFLLENYNPLLNKDEHIIQLFIDCVEDFFLIQNSLLPFLYPAVNCRQELIEFIKNLNVSLFNDRSEGSTNQYECLLNLFILLYCIQFKFHCLDSLQLHILTNQAIDSLDTSLPPNSQTKLLQLLLITTYSSLSTNCFSSKEKDWYKNNTMITLHSAYKKLSVTGVLYQNYNDIEQDCAKKQSLIAFWCFVFLQHLFCFLFSMPKIVNLEQFPFSIGNLENLSKLNQNFLKPFIILLQFTNKDLSPLTIHEIQENSLKRDKLTLELESFRLILKKWRLFHMIKNNFTVTQLGKLKSDLNHFSMLDKSDIIEMKFTFFYLILTILVNQINIKSVDDKNNNPHTENDISYFRDNRDFIEISFDLLSLYYIIIMDGLKKEEKTNFKFKRPCNLVVSHFLPVLTYDIILFCINNLIDFADRIPLEYKLDESSLAKVNEKEVTSYNLLEQYWSFIKYKRFLINWCKVWFFTQVRTNTPSFQHDTSLGYLFSKKMFTTIITSFNIDAKVFDAFNRSNENYLVDNRKYFYAIDKFKVSEMIAENGNTVRIDENNSLFNLNKSNFDIIKQLLKSRDDLFNYNTSLTNVENNNTNWLTNKGSIALNENNKRNVNDFGVSVLNNSIPLEEAFHDNYRSNSSTTNNATNEKLANNSKSDQINDYKNLLPLFPEESDDGYIEDDDEDEDDLIFDNRPLEIKFNTRNRKNILKQSAVKPVETFKLNTNDSIKVSTDNGHELYSSNNMPKINNKITYDNPNKRKFDKLKDGDKMDNEYNDGNSMNNFNHRLFYRHPQQYSGNLTSINSSTVIRAISPQLPKPSKIYAPSNVDDIAGRTNHVDANSSINQDYSVNQPRELLLPNFVPVDYSLNNTYIKSPFASTLYLPNQINDPATPNGYYGLNANGIIPTSNNRITHNDEKNNLPTRLINSKPEK